VGGGREGACASPGFVRLRPMIYCFYGYLLISFNLGQCPDDATMLADAALHTLVITTDQVQLISCWAQVRCPMQHTPIFPIPCDYSVSYFSFCLLYSRPAHSIKVHTGEGRESSTYMMEKVLHTVLYLRHTEMDSKNK
jgi:hypothetical protein